MKLRSKRAIIQRVLTHCPFKKEVHVGDILVDINGHKFKAPSNIAVMGGEDARQLEIILKAAAEHAYVLSCLNNFLVG